MKDNVKSKKRELRKGLLDVDRDMFYSAYTWLLVNWDNNLDVFNEYYPFELSFDEYVSFEHMHGELIIKSAFDDLKKWVYN